MRMGFLVRRRPVPRAMSPVAEWPSSLPCNTLLITLPCDVVESSNSCDEFWPFRCSWCWVSALVCHSFKPKNQFPHAAGGMANTIVRCPPREMDSGESPRRVPIGALRPFHLTPTMR